MLWFIEKIVNTILLDVIEIVPIFSPTQIRVACMQHFLRQDVQWCDERKSVRMWSPRNSRHISDDRRQMCTSWIINCERMMKISKATRVSIIVTRQHTPSPDINHKSNCHAIMRTSSTQQQHQRLNTISCAKKTREHKWQIKISFALLKCWRAVSRYSRFLQAEWHNTLTLELRGVYERRGMVGPAGFEPATTPLWAVRSNRWTTGPHKNDMSRYQG